MSDLKAAPPTRQRRKVSTEYSLPTSGVLSYFPESWVSYGELARVDKPTGIWHFYFPHLFGTLYAACITGTPERLDELFYKNLVLFIGTFFFRSAWNDTLDYEYDRQVPRCRLRPLARGALSHTQGYACTATLAAFALWFIYILPVNCWIISVPNVVLASFYPFAKRVIDVPQVVLGFQQAIGLFIGVGATITKPDGILGFKNEGTNTRHFWALGALYFASFAGK